MIRMYVFAAAVAISSIGVSGDVNADTKIVVAYTAAGEFTPVFVAKEKGFFAKRGLDVSPTRIALASTVPAALVSNSAQIGVGTGPSLLQAVDGGLDLVAVSGAARQVKSNSMLSLVVRKNVRVDAPSDLNGKKIGVPGLNSVIEVVLRKWLKDRGITSENVTMIEAPFPQMNDMLRGGLIDAVAVLEPFRSKIIADGNGVSFADYFTDVKDGMLSGFWISTRAWASANPEAIKAYREAEMEAIAYITSHPDEAKEIEAKYLGVKFPGFPSYDISITAGDIMDYIVIGKELQLLRGNLDPDKLIAK